MTFGSAFRAILAAALAARAANGLAADDVAYFPADADRGRRLAVVCLSCHGVPDLPAGTTPSFRVPKLAGQRGEAIFAALRDYQSGARPSPIMAAFVANLSIQDMRDLGAYLSASGPYVPGTYGQGTPAHEKVHRDCTSCHGESGMGVMAGIPVLTGQHEDYLVYALSAYRDGTREDPTMGVIARKLSEDEIRQLAAYFAGQEHLKVSDVAR